MYFVLISLVFLILLYNYWSLDSEEEQNHVCAPDHPQPKWNVELYPSCFAVRGFTGSIYFPKLLTGAYNFGSSGEFMEMLKNSYFKEPGKVISGKIQFSSFRSLGKFGKFLNYL